MTEPAQEKEQNNILRFIFLNLLIIAFIIISYVYISEPYGSISTKFIENQEFSINFGVSLMILAFFSVLAGSIPGLIAGFLGEFFYQLAFYNSLHLEWCFIIAILGFLCGIYKYKPLKYKNNLKVYYTFLVFIIISFVISCLIIMFQFFLYRNKITVENIIINYGFTFFLQSIISMVFIVPILLIIYDHFLATEKKDLYYLTLTHHPVSASDHTIFLKFGRTKIYFCSRCSGVIIGGLFSLFIFYLIGKMLHVKVSAEIALLFCIILPIPGIIDWGTQRLLLRKATTESRLFTGFILGMALNSMSYTYEYYFYTMLILIFYFSLFGLLVFFGAKKENRLLKEELDNLSSEESA